MTLRQFQTIIDDLIASGHGRASVCISKDTFTHPLQEVSIHDVCGAKIRSIAQIDGDGWVKTTKRGAEVSRQCCLIYGNSGMPCCGLAEEACQCGNEPVAAKKRKRVRK